MLYSYCTDTGHATDTWRSEQGKLHFPAVLAQQCRKRHAQSQIWTVTFANLMFVLCGCLLETPHSQNKTQGLFRRNVDVRILKRKTGTLVLDSRLLASNLLTLPEGLLWEEIPGLNCDSRPIWEDMPPERKLFIARFSSRVLPLKQTASAWT